MWYRILLWMDWLWFSVAKWNVQDVFTGTLSFHFVVKETRVLGWRCASSLNIASNHTLREMIDWLIDWWIHSFYGCLGYFVLLLESDSFYLFLLDVLVSGWILRHGNASLLVTFSFLVFSFLPVCACACACACACGYLMCGTHYCKSQIIVCVQPQPLHFFYRTSHTVRHKFPGRGDLCVAPNKFVCYYFLSLFPQEYGSKVIHLSIPPIINDSTTVLIHTHRMVWFGIVSIVSIRSERIYVCGFRYSSTAATPLN